MLSFWRSKDVFFGFAQCASNAAENTQRTFPECPGTQEERGVAITIVDDGGGTDKEAHGECEKDDATRPVFCRVLRVHRPWL